MSSDSRGKYLAKNTAIFAFGELCYKVIHFFMVPLCTYTLSTTEYGTVDFMLSVLTIVNSFTMCSIGDAIRRFLLEKDADDGRIRATQYSWNAIGIVFSIILFAVIKMIPAFSQYALIMSAYTFTISLQVTWSDYLKGKEKLIQYTVCSTLVAIGTAVLSVIFLKYLKMGVTGYFLPYIICYVFGSVVAFILGKQYKGLKNVRFDKKTFKEMTSFSATLIPNTIMWWIMSSSDRIMVTSMISASANGLYSVAYKLPSLMSSFNSIIMRAWQFSAVKESESEDREEYNNRMFKFYFSSIALIAAGAFLILKPFTKLYVAAEYYSAWKYSPFLIVGLLFQTLSDFVGTTYFVAKDMKSNLLSSTVGAVVNIVLNFCLIPVIGANGAAIATCISYIAIFVFRVINTRKYLVVRTVTPYTISVTAIIALMLLFVYLESFWSFILMAICCIAILLITKDTFISLIKKKQ